MDGFLFQRLKSLTLEQVIALAQAKEADDTPAMAEVVTRFDRYAIYLGRSMSTCPYEQDAIANAARIALVRAVRRHDRGRRGFGAFASRYMQGAALRELKQARRSELEVSLEAVGEPLDEAHAEDEDFVLEGPWGDGAVAAAVATLTPGQQVIARLRYVEDASLAQIAAFTGTSSSAVSQRLATIHRAVETALAA